MEIHVNNQTAGVINYVEGTYTVYGGVHGSVVTDDDAWRAVGGLREALTSVAHPGQTRAGLPAYSSGSPSCWPAPDR